MIVFESGTGETTQIGFVNDNGQQCHGSLWVAGTDHKQYAYKMSCNHCGYVYGANGSDIAGRLCPKCQGGANGIQYWL